MNVAPSTGTWFTVESTDLLYSPQSFVSAATSPFSSPLRIGGVANEAFSFIETAEPGGTAVDVEEPVVNLFESDLVAGEYRTDEGAVGVPADPPVVGDEPRLEMPRLDEGRRVLPVGRG